MWLNSRIISKIEHKNTNSKNNCEWDHVLQTYWARNSNISKWWSLVLSASLFWRNRLNPEIDKITYDYFTLTAFWCLIWHNKNKKIFQHKCWNSAETAWERSNQVICIALCLLSGYIFIYDLYIFPLIFTIKHWVWY